MEVLIVLVLLFCLYKIIYYLVVKKNLLILMFENVFHIQSQLVQRKILLVMCVIELVIPSHSIHLFGVEIDLIKWTFILFFICATKVFKLQSQKENLDEEDLEIVAE